MSALPPAFLVNLDESEANPDPSDDNYDREVCRYMDSRYCTPRDNNRHNDEDLGPRDQQSAYEWSRLPLRMRENYLK